MTPQNIPSANHVARYCKPSQIGSSGAIRGEAFGLRKEKNEEYLSCNWLEYLKKPDRSAEIREVCRVLRNKKFTLKNNGRIAVLNVGEVILHVKEILSIPLSILHMGGKEDPSYSGIYGLKDETTAFAVQSEIASKITDTYSPG